MFSSHGLQVIKIYFRRFQPTNNKMGDDEVKLPRIPENLLKRRKQVAVGKAKSIKDNAANRKKQTSRKRVVFQRAEKFVKEYRVKERDEIRLSRMARRTASTNIPVDHKLAFVIRIGGASSIHARPKKVLHLLNLRQINNGVFVKLNKTALSLLKIVEPYVTWGIPSLKTIRELIYKKGYGKVNRLKVPLTDNAIIERELGDKGIICMEDLLHEISTDGPNFKYAANFLWPFKLTSPLAGFKHKYRHFNEGGDFGFRDTAIDELVKQMI